MRALITSTLFLFILIGIWGIFHHYSTDMLKQILVSCEETVMPAIEKEDWPSASREFAQQYEIWHDYRQKALYILETDSIDQTEEGFAKTLMYIKAEDLSNSSGELLALQKSLNFLHQSDSITLKNIL